jgi:hypothetical protein
MLRWLFFFLFIAIGITLGLLFGWVVSPITSSNASAESLRIDYTTDFVLMVAEAYQLHPDPERASQRLALLGNSSTPEKITQAIRFAERIGYSDVDLALMRTLSEAFIGGKTMLDTPVP